MQWQTSVAAIVPKPVAAGLSSTLVLGLRCRAARAALPTMVLSDMSAVVLIAQTQRRFVGVATQKEVLVLKLTVRTVSAQIYPIFRPLEVSSNAVHFAKSQLDAMLLHWMHLMVPANQTQLVI